MRGDKKLLLSPPRGPPLCSVLSNPQVTAAPSGVAYPPLDTGKGVCVGGGGYGACHQF